MNSLPSLLFTVALLAWPRGASGDEPWPEDADESEPWPPDDAESEPTVPPRGAPRSEPAPSYASPFQLRNVVPKNGLKADSTMAFYRQGDVDGRVTVVFLSGQVRLARSVALSARWGFDDHRVSGGTVASRTGILNPTLAMLLGWPLGNHFRLALSTTVGVPVATGGGDSPDSSDVALQRQASLARSAFDNTSFSLNDVGFPTGLSLAFVGAGLTLQLDATLIPTVRVKGAAAQPDESKLNSSYGFFVGYFLASTFSLGIETRYQRYLSTPSSVAADPSARDNLTLGGGARAHILLSEGVWLRPGICYGEGLRGRIEQQSFRIVQLDLPLSF